MAFPNKTLVKNLRKTASQLQNGAYYSWGHHGGCNCGNLLQVVTNLSKEEILIYAHTTRGEWTEIAEEYCPTSLTPAFLMISKLEEIGLTPTDIHNIEYLQDKEVLTNLPGGFRWLKKNDKNDAIEYFQAFANVLERKIPVS